MKKMYSSVLRNLLAVLLTVITLNSSAQTGKSLNFDPTVPSDYIQTPVLLPASYTKEAWIKISNSSGLNNNIISGDESNGQHYFWVPNGQLSSGHNGTFSAVQDPAPLTLNTWYHVAVTYDAPSTTMKLYKDGLLLSTNTGVPALTGQAVYIGAYFNAGPLGFLNGSIDDVRIWSSALTATEIMNRKNCELLGTEPGLVAYYKFNQGVGGANNAGVTTLTNSTATTGLDGTLFNFALTGNTSNWQTSTAVTPSIATSNITQTLSITGTTVFSSGTCSDLITTVIPNGASPISGSTTAKVWIEPSQPVAFGKRHYEITPAANSTTATATVTLYFTQQEFTDFNADGGNILKLPTGSADASGIANLRIEKRPGTSGDGSGLPSSYTGTATTIDPNDANIVWNSDVSRWEVTFAVTGFSGFFVKTTTASLLPVRWLSINGVINGQKEAVVNWLVQENNVLNYSVEKSSDGVSFSIIANLNSKGDGTNNYNFTDSKTLSGIAYYRIKQMDKDAKIFFSPIIKLSNNQIGRLVIYPNPVREMVSISGATIGSIAIISDLSGKPLQQIKVTQSAFVIDMSKYSNGVYVLKTDSGVTQKIIKQ